MSQRKTRGNPNLRRTTRVPPTIAGTPTEDIPQPAVGTPNSTATATVVTAIPTNQMVTSSPGSSNLLLDSIESSNLKDFGKDKDMKNLLKTLQPKAFRGEGTNVPKTLEEWIMSMDDYFTLAGYNATAQGIMGRAKLEGSAKLWWKLHCQAQGRTEISMGWGELKDSLKERYLPLNYDTVKMNEFLACVRKGKPIDEYYEEFVKLSRHAPLMTQEQKLSRFILGLEGQLAEEVNALRPTSLANALIRAKAKLLSFQAGDRKRMNPYPPPAAFRPQKTHPPNRQFPNRSFSPSKAPASNVQPVKVNALPINQSGHQI